MAFVIITVAVATLFMSLMILPVKGNVPNLKIVTNKAETEIKFIGYCKFTITNE